jgi:hypothetical protein
MGEEVAEYNGAYKHLKECLQSLRKEWLILYCRAWIYWCSGICYERMQNQL